MTAHDAPAGSPAEQPFQTELLFTDGLPQMDDEVGYRGAVAARAAGITYRQLDYWARTELVEPTVRGASGSGSQRLYGFRDILVLKLVKRLFEGHDDTVFARHGEALSDAGIVNTQAQDSAQKGHVRSVSATGLSKRVVKCDGNTLDRLSVDAPGKIPDLCGARGVRAGRSYHDGSHDVKDCHACLLVRTQV